MAAALWGRGGRILFRSGNQAVVAALASYLARDPPLVHLLRCLFFFEAYFEFEHVVEHVPWSDNGAADAISRKNITSFLFSLRPTPHHLPPSTTRGAAFDRSLVCTLETIARGYFASGLSARTVNSYASAQRRHLAFCEVANLPPQCIFVAFLANQWLSHQSITSYLSGVRNLAVAGPPNRGYLSCLQLVFRGVARSMAQGNTVRPPHLPITRVIMHQLAGVWSGQSRLMWVATCVGYFGFMRVGEFTAVDSVPPNLK